MRPWIRRLSHTPRLAGLVLPVVLVLTAATGPGAAAGAVAGQGGPTLEEPSLGLIASASVILWASTVTLTADFGSLGADRLILFQSSRDGTAFSVIATPRADASGRASVPFHPSDNRYYRAVFQGAADLAPRQSTDLRVVVRQYAALRPLVSGVRNVRAGSTRTFSTLVRPSRLDLPVPIVRYVLYRLDGDGGWTLTATEDVTADGGGVARWAVTFVGHASWYVRSMALPTPLNANSAWSPIQRFDSR